MELDFELSDFVRKGSRSPRWRPAIGAGEAEGQPGAAAGIQAGEDLPGSRHWPRGWRGVAMERGGERNALGFMSSRMEEKERGFTDVI